MPAQYIYNHAIGSNVDLSAHVRAYRSEASANAEEGAVAISTFYVDDELGGLDIQGHHTFTWAESSEGSNTRTILKGLIADTDVSRGPYKLLKSRQWAVNVADPNTMLGRLIMRGSDANRPAETDLARIQWLMSTGEMNLISDSTYINTSAATVNMDAVDYRDQTVLSIIDDCAQASGKNYWVYWQEITNPGTFGLWYDFATSTAYTSSVRLTNVLADVDSSTTFAVFNEDLKLNRDPSRIYSGVLMPYDGGEVFVEDYPDDTTRLMYSRRYTTAPSINVKSSAKATARAQRYLVDIATPEDRVTCSYLVPLSKVNQLQVGQRFQAKFSHLPGLTDYSWLRVLRRTVRAESEEFYRVTIEASPTGVSGSLGVVQTTFGERDASFPNQITPGHLIIAINMQRDNTPETGGGYSGHSTNKFTFMEGVQLTAALNSGNPRAISMWKYIVPSDISADTVTGDGRTFRWGQVSDRISLIELSGATATTNIVSGAFANTTGDLDCGGAITPTSGSNCIIIGANGYDGSQTLTPVSGPTEYCDNFDSPHQWAAYRQITGASGSYTIRGHSPSSGGHYIGITTVVVG